MTTESGIQRSRVLILDSATDLDASAAGTVAITGSHGGVFSAHLAARARVRGAVFNDAGGGLANAGVSGLALLQSLGMAAVAVSTDSARIGDGNDTFRNGILSTCNDVALGLGIRPGLACRTAAGIMAERGASGSVGRHHAPAYGQSRRLVASGPIPVWALDSASLVSPEDEGAILATGSHGGTPGGDGVRALRCAAALAAFNDAGMGKDGAGIGRLAVLDRRNVPAVAVATATARIGDGLSTLRDGRISATNPAAERLGARPGMPLRLLIDRLLRAAP